MRRRLNSLSGALRSSYWFIPTLMMLLSAVLAVSMIRLHQSLEFTAFRSLGFVYFNQPDGARSLVSTVASSKITVAGTTFSITLAVLSLTSGQFGSRLLNNFMRDLGNQIVLGTFVSTYVYCLLVLRTIHSGGDAVGEAFVPHLSVLLVILFALSSLGVFIYFIHHTASSIQASTITARIAGDLEKSIPKLYPERGGADAPLPEGRGTLLYARTAGYLQDLDEKALLDAAEKYGVALEVLPAFGTFLLPGQPLLRIFGEAEGFDVKRLERHFTFGARRNAGRDIDFLFAQLTEMALRALSPGVNDAVTAMRCADRVAQGLLLLEGRDLSGQRRRGACCGCCCPNSSPPLSRTTPSGRRAASAPTTCSTQSICSPPSASSCRSRKVKGCAGRYCTKPSCFSRGPKPNSCPTISNGSRRATGTSPLTAQREARQRCERSRGRAEELPRLWLPGRRFKPPEKLLE